MKGSALLLLATALVAGADEPKPGGDRDRLQGAWRLVSWASDGRDLVADHPDLFQAMDVRWTFEGDTLAQTGTFQGLNERGVEERAFRLDPGQSPKWLDVRSGRGPDAPFHKGIYALDGKKLRVCYNPDPRSGDRPAAFAAGKGSKCLLFEFERVGGPKQK